MLYALSSVRCFQKILNSVYIHSLDTIRSHGQMPVSSLIYYIARAMFHLKSSTMQDSFFEDLCDSIFTHLSNYMTYEFVDIYVRCSHAGVLREPHREHPLRNQVPALHRKRLRERRPQRQNRHREQVVGSAHRSALFSRDLLAEDSLLNSCFSGKFLIVNKCSSCQEVSFGSEDFLSLNLEVFTSDQSDHIKNLRKEFGIGGDPKDKKKSWGIFKAFSRLA